MLGLLQGTSSRADPPAARLLGYGGAAFGGKTDADLGLAAVAAFAFPGCRVGFFRRTYPELEGPDGPVERSRELFAGITEYNGERRRHTFPTGSRLYFHHCNDESDRFSYQSQAWDILILDEATHFTWPIVDYLITRNRPTIDNPDLVPFVVMTTNPGNVGHGWYLQLYDVLQEEGAHRQVKRRLTPNGKYERSYFIPAYLEDNVIGLNRDPEYGDRLEARDPEVARALRYGDWSIFAGQAFPMWGRERMTCDPFPVSEWWPKWRALDYGFVHPFVCGWFTRDPDNNRVYCYRATSQSNLTDRQQARVMRDMTAPGEMVAMTYASPDMWARKTKDDLIFTSVDEYALEGVYLQKADDNRLSGKRKLDRLLVDLPDGKPGLQIFEPYWDVFKGIGGLVRDTSNPEDIKKVDGDDAYDMLRYALTNLNLAGAKQMTEQERERVTANPYQMVGGML